MDELTPKLIRLANDWRSLTDSLHSLREEEVVLLLRYEMRNSQRKSHLRRLHQRANTLRVARERKELMC